MKIGQSNHEDEEETLISQDSASLSLHRNQNVHKR